MRIETGMSEVKIKAQKLGEQADYQGTRTGEKASAQFQKHS